MIHHKAARNHDIFKHKNFVKKERNLKSSVVWEIHVLVYRYDQFTWSPSQGLFKQTKLWYQNIFYSFDFMTDRLELRVLVQMNLYPKHVISLLKIKSAIGKFPTKYHQKIINTLFSRFVLGTSFPKRRFTSEEESQSFRQLGLTPSTALTVIPIQSAISNSSNGLVSTIMAIIMIPINIVLSILSSITGNATNATQQPTASSAGPSSSNNPNLRRRKSSFHFFIENWALFRKIFFSRMCL